MMALPPPERFKAFSSEWSSLSQEEKARYKRQSGPSQMSLAKRKKEWKKAFSKVSSLMNYMESLLPTDSLFMTSAAKSAPICSGTEMGIRFIESSEAGIEMVSAFHSYIKVGYQTSDIVTLKMIQDLFNLKYAEMTSKPGAKMPYSKLHELRITMKGLPSDIVLKKPAHYGSEQRSKIWAVRDTLVCATEEA